MSPEDRKRQSLMRYYVERIAYHKARQDEPGRRGAWHRRRAAMYRTRLDQTRHGGRIANRRAS